MNKRSRRDMIIRHNNSFIYLKKTSCFLFIVVTQHCMILWSINLAYKRRFLYAWAILKSPTKDWSAAANIKLKSTLAKFPNFCWPMPEIESTFVLCHIYVGFHSWSEIFSTSNLNYSLIWKIKLVSIYTSSMPDVFII